MALATRPRLLLLDEPMAGTGAEETEHLITTLAALRGEMGLLLVEGRLTASGDPARVRADPAVQAAYLGQEAVHAGGG